MIPFYRVLIHLFSFFLYLEKKLKGIKLKGIAVPLLCVFFFHLNERRKSFKYKIVFVSDNKIKISIEKKHTESISRGGVLRWGCSLKLMWISTIKVNWRLKRFQSESCTLRLAKRLILNFLKEKKIPFKNRELISLNRINLPREATFKN